MKTIKRTKNINHKRFRKVHTFYKYSAIFILINSTFFLTACDEQQNVSVYSNVQECEKQAKNVNELKQCTVDYNNALINSKQSAPKFSSNDDCEAEFGTQQCYQTNNTNNPHSSFMWIPIMHGYTNSSANYPSQALYSSTNKSSPLYNKFVDSKGNSFGNFTHSGYAKVNSSSLQYKAPTTNTVTRSGFGSTVKAHSSHSYGSHGSMGG